MGSEGSCEVGGVGMEVVGMVADTAPSSGKGVRYGVFGGGGMTTSTRGFKNMLTLYYLRM